MVTNAVFLFCAQAILAHSIFSQCIGFGYNGFGADGLAWGPAAHWNTAPLAASWATAPCAATPFVTAEWAISYAPAAFAASNRGGFPVTSASPVTVTGVSMASENLYEGALDVAGAVPFLGSVALEGALPTAGAGAISYSCGNGNVIMVTEDISAGLYAYGPGIAAAGIGYGCGPLAYETAIAGPAYSYNGVYGCGGVF